MALLEKFRLFADLINAFNNNFTNFYMQSLIQFLHFNFQLWIILIIYRISQISFDIIINFYNVIV